jgi:hypothetical protein
MQQVRGPVSDSRGFTQATLAVRPVFRVPEFTQQQSNTSRETHTPHGHSMRGKRVGFPGVNCELRSIHDSHANQVGEAALSGVWQEIASWTLTTLLGGLVGYLVSLVKHGIGRDRAMDHGMQVLLRARLIDIHVKYVEHDEPCPVNVKEEADEVYEAYHSLGGNGTGTHLHEEIMDAHIASHAQQHFDHPSGWPTAIGSQEDI